MAKLLGSRPAEPTTWLLARNRTWDEGRRGDSRVVYATTGQTSPVKRRCAAMQGDRRRKDARSGEGVNPCFYAYLTGPAVDSGPQAWTCSASATVLATRATALYVDSSGLS